MDSLPDALNRSQ